MSSQRYVYIIGRPNPIPSAPSIEGEVKRGVKIDREREGGGGQRQTERHAHTDRERHTQTQTQRDRETERAGERESD